MEELVTYHKENRCKKCGTTDAISQWVPECENEYEGNTPEYIQRECHECGFSWKEDVI